MNYPDSMTMSEIRQLEGYGMFDDSEYSNMWDDIVSFEVINEETNEPYTEDDYEDFVSNYGYEEVEKMYDKFVLGEA